MHIKPNYNKKKEIISYRLMASGKDPNNGNNKVYTKTWKIPKDLSIKEIKKELEHIKSNFIKEVEKLSNGIQIKENNIKFVDFANEWLEEIINYNHQSYSFYNRAKQNLKTILPFFQKYTLNNISPMLVQEFYNYICSRTYIKETATVKKSVANIINEQKLNKTKIASDIGVARLTLRLASTIGQKVNIKTAKAICKYFNIPLEKYFDIKKEECLYSKATNASIRTTLVMILGKAKRLRLIEHNFASKDFTKPITGTTKIKEVYNEDEAREYVKSALNLENIKHKTILLLPLLHGLRRCEIAGLQWQDIDFEKQLISIERDIIYNSTFGTQETLTKSDSSKRILPLTETMLKVLKEYKLWYEKQKNIHGDLWLNTDFLFLQDIGKVINPCSITQLIQKFEAVNGFKNVPVHSLRHTCITLQLSAGIPIKVVSQMAGHADEKITLEIYTHMLKNQDKTASEIYNNFLCGIT